MKSNIDKIKQDIINGKRLFIIKEYDGCYDIYKFLCITKYIGIPMVDKRDEMYIEGTFGEAWGTSEAPNILMSVNSGSAYAFFGNSTTRYCKVSDKYYKSHQTFDDKFDFLKEFDKYNFPYNSEHNFIWEEIRAKVLYW